MTSQTRHRLLYWPWLSLPLVLLSYLVFWRSLPEQMGVHIGLNGKTDGWMSREASLLISLFGLLMLLLVSTWQVKRHHFSTKRLLRHCAGACILTAVLMFTLLRNL